MVKLAIVGGTGLSKFLENGERKEITAVYRDKGVKVERAYQVEEYSEGSVIFVNRQITIFQIVMIGNCF